MDTLRRGQDYEISGSAPNPLVFGTLGTLGTLGSALGGVVVARRRPLRIPALQGAAFSLLHLTALGALSALPNLGLGGLLIPLVLWTPALLVPARRA